MTQVTALASPLPDVHLFVTDVSDWALADVQLADADEVATFATQKRREEHLSGRWLLGEGLKRLGESDLSAIEVVRSEERAPSLHFIQGAWRRTPLPRISLAHSEGRVFLAVSSPDVQVGIDVEPLDRTLAANAFDMMAKGEELAYLKAHPAQAMQWWTGKEAVQKALGLGMHLNPRRIEIPIGEGSKEISVENSKIQLEYWQSKGYHISLALTPVSPGELTPEERLLEETRLAMEANPEWGVGCKTLRNNA